MKYISVTIRCCGKFQEVNGVRTRYEGWNRVFILTNLDKSVINEVFTVTSDEGRHMLIQWY